MKLKVDYFNMKMYTSMIENDKPNPMITGK